MGYLTTIVIHNDALHCFKQDPKKFAESIFNGINEAQETQKECTVPFEGYCNYIAVHPPRHADDETIYLHSENEVTNLNIYNEDFRQIAKSNPKLAKDLIRRAQRILTESKKHIK